MPSKKPVSLLRGKDLNKDQRAARESAEAAIAPRDPLPATPPKYLIGKVARSTWERLVSLWEQAEKSLATRVDEDAVILFCELRQEIDDFKLIRADVEKQRGELEKQLGKTPRKGDDKGWQNFLKMQDQYSALTGRLCSLDSRVDSKRAKLLDLASVLYLTPRARAGVPIEGKEEERELSPIEKLLIE